MQEVCTFEQLIMIKIVIENVCGKGDVPDDMKCCFLLEPFKSCSLMSTVGLLSRTTTVET